MRRGFSLYAPLVGIILVSMAFIIMGALINEENARVAYLRMMRATYAYILPTQTMRYDALTAFSVAARIYFENAVFSAKNGGATAPDVKTFLDSFIKSFTFAPGGQIVETQVNWKKGDATVSTAVKGDYLILTVTPKGVGPTYTIKLAAGQGREETITVPIFTGKTSIYIPYPVGQVKDIARTIYTSLAGFATSGRLAYGYCTRFMKDGDTSPVVVFGEYEPKKNASWRDIREKIEKYLQGRLPNDTKITDVYNIETDDVPETYKVDAVDFLTLHGECGKYLRNRNALPLILAVPKEGPAPLYCRYVTGFYVSGYVKTTGASFPFTVYVSLPHHNGARNMRKPSFISKSASFFFNCTCRSSCQCGSVCENGTSDACNECKRRCEKCKSACENCKSELKNIESEITNNCPDVDTYILGDNDAPLKGLDLYIHTRLPESECIVYQEAEGVYCKNLPWHECKQHRHNH